jgi:hypothetical protein
VIDRDQYQRNETFLIRLGEPVLVRDDDDDDDEAEPLGLLIVSNCPELSNTFSHI